MESRTLSLSKILTNEVRYTVPLFQRKYVWNEQDNWWPLWTDIVETTSRLMADQATGASSTRPHFLGAVVHEGLPVRAGQLPEQRVIDGQQRMITIQLILSATGAVAEERGYMDEAKRVRRLVHNPDDVVKEASDQFKVWPTNADRAAFVAAVDDRPDGSLIGSAYTFFKTRVACFVEKADAGAGWDPSEEDDWVGPSIGADSDSASPDQRLDAFVDTLRDLIRVVVIELNPVEDDAQVIFETLNAHGTDLLPSDLVKNHMFNRAQVAQLDVDALHVKYWAPLEDAWYSGEDSVGRSHRQRLNLAIGYWAALSSPRGADITHSHLFSIVQEIARARCGPMAKPKPDAVTALFADISHHVSVWRRLRLAGYETPEGRFMTRLRDLATTTPMPLVLWMAAKVEQEIPRLQFENALLSIESYLVRRASCGLTSKNYNRLFATVLGQAKESDVATVGTTVTSLLAGYTEDSSRWPEDDEFRDALTDVDQYRRFLRSTRIRMVLEALESAMLGPDVEQLAPPGAGLNIDNAPAGSGKSRQGKSFTVDHIMPQSWESNWPIAADLSNSAVAEEKRRRTESVHRLGNLTLVTGTKNAEMSNSAWPTKRSYLQTRSLLMLTQATVLAMPTGPGIVRRHDAKAQEADQFFADLWATDPTIAINFRGRCLAEWALHVWPR